jgi:TolB-like protein/class 3 adenylate cyclase
MAATRRLAAILAADVVGYSRLIGADEPGTLQRLRAVRTEVIDPAVGGHNGRIVKTTGDGLLIEFGSTVDALRCATQVQAAMVERNASTAPDNRIEFRIGIHQGDITAEDGDIFGDGVNIAARLEAIATPGGICVSARVQEDAAGKLDLGFRDLGEQRLHNIARPVRAYGVGLAARPRRSHRLWGAMIGAAGALAVILIAVAWWSWPREKPVLSTAASPPAVASAQRQPPSEARAAPPLSLVVLPFANLSNDPEQEYFADGITDDLTTDLSRLPGSFVIARNTAFTFKGKPTDVKQVGYDLGVRYVVEGSVRRTGDQVQLNVQLIDAESGTHLWADRFDTDRRGLANAQAEITVRLARMLDIKLVAAEVTRSEQRKALDPDARDFVMRGRNWWYRPTSPTVLKEARQAFERALEIDPRSNDARIGLARALAVAVTNAAGSASQDLTRAEQLAAEAIEQDPDSSMAHEAMGLVRLRQKNRLSEAQIELATSLAINRNNVLAVKTLGWVLLHLGEPEACIAQAEKFLRLSPRDPGLWDADAQLGVCHLFLNHTDFATDQLMKARAANPWVWWIPFNLAGALGLKGDLDGGRVALAASLKLKPEINSIAQYLALKPWYSSPQELPIEDRTLLEGLRRLGFPES